MERDPTTARAPATPLIVHDPFMSVWSMTDELTQSWSRHWSGKHQSMCGMIYVDGRPFRFMGIVTRMGHAIPAMRQIERRVTPLRTTYRFAIEEVELDLEFMTPSFPDNLELLALPVTYVTVAVRAVDGRAHDVSVYLDWSTNWATGEAETNVVWGRHRGATAEAVFVGAADQRPLRRSGDEVQIGWGYHYTSSEPGQPATSSFGDALTLRELFAATGTTPNRDDVRAERPLAMPANGHRGTVGPDPDGNVQDRTAFNVVAWSCTMDGVDAGGATWRMLVAYDQIFEVAYFERRLPPYWRRRGQSAIGLIDDAWARREELAAKAEAFDDALIAELMESGGVTYARLGILAFRQCLGGHALVEETPGRPLHFSKENSSNGCMGTVDLTYPSAPFFLLFNPALLEAQMRPVCEYAASGRWPFDYAPHDVGQFPLANGQVYGGGELTEHFQMPYEESANMLILAAALAQRTGSPRVFEEFRPQFQSWAKYLERSGVDPAEQLCTDDFAGHLKSNVNLSAKAIIGLGAFSLLLRMTGEEAEADRYLKLATEWTALWQAMADNGEGYALAFGRPDSWSQKYNLIWDRVLGLNLFPQAVLEREMKTYLGKLQPYGLPLDIRNSFIKTDWLSWTACLTGRREDFDALMEPFGRWLDDAPARVPLSDWFDGETGMQTRAGGFRARPTVGAVFMKLLIDRGFPTPKASRR